MENKIPEGLLNLYESLLSVQLLTIRQPKDQKGLKVKSRKKEGMSNMDMAIDILRRAAKPLNISEILAQVKSRYRVSLDRHTRESPEPLPTPSRRSLSEIPKGSNQPGTDSL